MNKRKIVIYSEIKAKIKSVVAKTNKEHFHHCDDVNSGSDIRILELVSWFGKNKERKQPVKESSHFL